MTNLLPNWIQAASGAYLVGGCVRDLLLGRKPTDYDIVLLEDAPEVARRLAAAGGGRVVEIGKPAFRIWRVIAAGDIIDVAPAVGASLAEDLRQRDFTINALAMDAANGEIVDATGGRADLNAGIIRITSPAVFRADPVRLLRAFRLAAQLGFVIDPPTLAVIGRDAGLIDRSAGERIREELFKLLAAAAAHPQIAAMQATGLLRALFPDAEPAGIAPALNCLRSIERILNGFAVFPPELAALLREEFQERRRVLLKCAALLRPVARPRPAAALERLRLSKRDAARLEFLMRPHLLQGLLAAGAGVSTAGALRFFRSAGDLAPDALVLAAADAMPEAVPPGERPGGALAAILPMMWDYFFRYRPRALAPAPITGDDLIREFGLTPSPHFKEILDRVQEERLSRASFSRAEALELVRSHLDRRP